MRFSEEIDSDNKLVRAYKTGSIRINNDWFNHSIIISGGEIQLWPVISCDEIEPQLLIEAISPDTEILLIGTGSQQHLMSPDLFKDLLLKGIGVEIMDSVAASRTYNILLSEGRQVAVALIIA